MLEPRSPELDHAATSQQLHSRKLKTAQIGSMVLTEDQKKQLRNWRTQVASAGATIVSSTCGVSSNSITTSSSKAQAAGMLGKVR